MKLIAETPQESRIIDRVCALLEDLGIAADGYRKNEAIAATFFSSEDILAGTGWQHMCPEEQEAVLCSIEDTVRRAMRTAGRRAAYRCLHNAGSGIAHPDRHMGV